MQKNSIFGKGANVPRRHGSLLAKKLNKIGINIKISL
jgi:hypothetical protein